MRKLIEAVHDEEKHDRTKEIREPRSLSRIGEGNRDDENSGHRRRNYRDGLR